MTSRQLANVLIKLSGLLGLLHWFPNFAYGALKAAYASPAEPINAALAPAITVRGLLDLGFLLMLFFCSQFIANVCFKIEKDKNA
jgi:hypothetical protein